MAWIESHETLQNHPKTKRLRRLLKINGVTAVGHLHYLWWWAMKHAQDGNLDKYDALDIADACEWEDEEEIFFNALVESGFIDETETGYCLHDWYEYAGKMIELRARDAARKKEYREKKAQKAQNPEDVHRTSMGHPEESEGNLSESIRNPNPNPNPNPKTSKTLKEFSQETTDLTTHLIDMMKMNNPNVKIPSNLETWNDAIDKLQRLDKHDFWLIRSVIDWSQQDKFWKSNILSAPKLREKFDTLLLQAKEQGQKRSQQETAFEKIQRMYREEVAAGGQSAGDETYRDLFS
jgi:hypothetical protein